MFRLGEPNSSDTPAAKTYRCVACSATFSGLASLLVHQATHAGEFSAPTPPAQPTCSSCGLVFAHKDILKQHLCPKSMPSSITESCGSKNKEERKGFIGHESPQPNEMDQNQSAIAQGTVVEAGTSKATAKQASSKHVVELISSPGDQSSEGRVTKCHIESDNDLVAKKLLPEPAANKQVPNNTPLKTVSLSDQVLEPAASALSSNNIDKIKVSLQKSETLSSNIEQIKIKHFDQLLESVKGQDQTAEPVVHNLPSNNIEKNNVSLLVEKTATLEFSSTSHDTQEIQPQNRRIRPSRNKALMRILANAYMNVSRPADDTGLSDQPDLQKKSNRPLRSTRKSIKTMKIPKIHINEKNMSQKPLLSVVKRYSPVVLLETRQQFCNSDINNVKHFQCGTCKRLFTSADELVLHHASHKKERLKICPYCNEFIVRTSLGVNQHICPKSPTIPIKDHQSKEKVLRRSPKQMDKTNSLSKEVLKLNMPLVEKSFRCPVCERTYTRLYNLKKHSCQGKPSRKEVGQELNTTTNIEIGKMMVNGTEGNEKESTSTAVGTDVYLQIKKEVITSDVIDMDQLPVQTNNENPSEEGQCESLEFFNTVDPQVTPLDVLEKCLKDKPSPPAQTESTEAAGIEELDDTEDGLGIGLLDEVDDIDDSTIEAEIDVLLEEDEDNANDASTISEMKNEDHSLGAHSDEHFRRFSCGQCHKSFTRNYGLKKHLKICGFGQIRRLQMRNSAVLKVDESERGLDFGHLNDIISSADNRGVQQTSSPRITPQTDLLEPYNAPPQDNVFVLPPLPETQSSSQVSQDNSNDQSWGIMSLPSVLPRKVTCECGSGFTCPRRLFEHLQMHAQETYICRNCGESVHSWSKFEAHLRSHAQTQRQLNTEERQKQHIVAPYQPQQPFISRPLPQVVTQFTGQPQVSQPAPCPRCFKIFKTRKSLLRHMKRSCPADIAQPKRFTCTRCGMSFLSTSTLSLHMQSNTCAPAVNAMHCPVCAQQFTSVEGLKNHLVVHSQHKVFSCRICPQSFSDPNDLEDHKKCVHSDEQEGPQLQRQETRDVSQNISFKYFRCHLCTKVYHSMMALKVHRKRSHGLSGESLIPQLSDSLRGMQSSETLRVMPNSQLNIFRCQICQRAYHSLTSLKNHRRKVHRVCADGQPLPQRINVGSVQNNLSSNNIYRCQICPRAYPTVKAWRNHRRRVHRILGGGPEMHTDDSLTVKQMQSSSFPCPSCPRIFLTLQSLKDHQSKTHSILGGMLDVQRHSNAVTNNSPPDAFTCQICNRRYFNLQSLKDHQRKVHRMHRGRVDVIKIE